MNFKSVAAQLLPPLLHRALTRRARRLSEVERLSAFYGQFLRPGDLCFDIGANMGNRVRCFRAMGVKVIAVEPQARCLDRLRKEFLRDPEVTIVPVAAGSAAGKGILQTSPVHVLSTLSRHFPEKTRDSGRFEGVRWDGEEAVEIRTLDSLIEDHGLPRFIKIDVEGFEGEVLAGLSRVVPAISFEWTPEIPETTLTCIKRLDEIGVYEYNYSWGESMRLARPFWMSGESIGRVVEEFAGENLMFGDIYARLREPSSPGC